MERQWALEKFKQGISHRQTDYETKYFAMIQKSFPETWGSWRNFEATRGVYNMICKFELLDILREELGSSCDFLHPELQTDSTLMMFKEALSMVSNNFSTGLNWLEMKAFLIELLIRFVKGLVLNMLQRSIHTHTPRVCIIELQYARYIYHRLEK